LVHGLSHGRFLDERDYWPIFARAEALGVPIYLHPALPDKSVIEKYYSPYDKTHPAFTRAAWGFGVETGTMAMRMVLSGVFDEYPNLNIILGHLGEGIPYQLARIDESLSRKDNQRVSFAKTFRQNFHVTTSGFFSDPALRCCIDEMGVERIMFAVDWPYVKNDDGVNWLSKFDMDSNQKAQIFNGNAKRLLRL
jgi:predicted TIM-barrel fold metal-dependent hydrolase